MFGRSSGLRPTKIESYFVHASAIGSRSSSTLLVMSWGISLHESNDSFIEHK